MTTMAIGAHPDDIEFGCGGTLGLAAERGERLVHVVVTSGEEGGLGGESLALRREDEARASAKVLGAEAVHFLREPDGLTGFQKETKIRLIRLIREVRPDRIFVHAASDLFPDHVIVSRLSQDAIVAAAGPWYPAAGLEPHSVSDVFGFEVWHPIPAPALYVDVSAAMEKKRAALHCHESQVGTVDYIGAVEGLARYRGALSMKGSFVEAFEVLKQGSLR